MSEPSSLFCRVRLSTDALSRYLSSRIGEVLRFDDWRTINSEIEDYLDEIRYDRDQLNSSWFDTITKNTELCAKHTYLPETHEFQLSIFNFSESVLDFVKALNVLRHLSQFKDLPGTDFALIYSFFWDGHIDAICEINQRSSILRPASFASSEFSNFKDISDKALQSVLDGYLKDGDSKS